MPKQSNKKATKKTTKKTTSEKVILLTSSDNEKGEIYAKKQTTKRGQKDEYDNKVKPYLSEIAKYHRCGVTEGQLAEYYDVGKTSWAKYKQQHPEFSETLLKAKRELKTDLVNQSYKVAMGYEYEEEKTETYFDKLGNVNGSKTVKIKHYAKPDAGMLEFLLINRFPEEFARDPHAIEMRKKALELAEQGKLNPNDTEGL
jgi:hypothetical protein